MQAIQNKSCLTRSRPTAFIIIKKRICYMRFPVNFISFPEQVFQRTRPRDYFCLPIWKDFQESFSIR